MKILAIDASGIAGSVAYISDYKLMGEYYICNKLTHSQTIMPMMEHLKGILGLDLETLDAIAVTSGTGSFTGIRIGVATAKAMAMALNIPIIGIPTMDVMANNIHFTSAIVCPIMDARRSQVYTALYEWKEESQERISDYLAEPIDDLLDTLDSKNREVVFVGDAIDIYKEKIVERLGKRAKFAPSFLQMQRAGALADLACKAFEKGEGSDPDLFVPIYLRKCQAERELEEREQRGN